MKRLFAISTILLTVASCQKFDDSAIRSKLNEQTTELSSQESRIKTIEQQLARYNTDIASVKTVVENIGAGIVVKQCIPFRLNGATGYTLSFSDGTSATVYDGKDGTNGGVPVVSFASVDGVLCWTIDGKLLKDADGKQIPVKGAKGAPGADGKNGADADPNAGTATPGTPGKSPALRISGGNWEWSTDGTNWTVLGPATGVQGQTGNQGSAGKDGQGSVSFFKSVTKSADGKKMTFELKDGTRYAVNIGKPSCYTVSADGETLTFQIGKASFEMALVKAGTFTMGDGSQKEVVLGVGTYVTNPAHKVTLTKDFWIMKENMDTTTAFELLTKEEKEAGYWRVTRLLPDPPLPTTKYIFFETQDDSPIINEPHYVRKQTYIDIIIDRLKIITEVKFDVPTEAQWEYAAKGGHKSKGYKYFGTNSLETLINADENHKNELGISGMKCGKIRFNNPIKDGADWGPYFGGYRDGDVTDPCPIMNSYWGGVSRQSKIYDSTNDDLKTEYRTKAPTSRHGHPRLVVYAEDLN